ncbi:two component sensor kinase [Mycobacterium tuberculosis RGTB423]|nr:two component sensor kinase [Mycobacterium tuberculosis RGTB423]
MPSYGNLGRLGGRHEYGVLVAMTSSAELDRVRWAHQLRSYRIASVLRIGVVGGSWSPRWSLEPAGPNGHSKSC